MRLADLRGRSVAVWGSGREGVAAAAAIADHAPARLVAVDDTVNFLSLDWSESRAKDVPLVTGDDCHDALMAAEVIVRSPGVPQTHPWIVEARAREITVTGGSALWMADHAAATVGVTGSKGKSTTASLISHLLSATGRPNVLGGNIGVPLLDLPDTDQYVLELSSYQCSDLTDSPRVAVVTALFPEHLDAHGGQEEYYRDKLNILAHNPETVVVNGLDERLAAEIGNLPAVRAGLPDSYHVRDEIVYRAETRLFDRDVLPLVGRHNERNLCVALAVLEALGIDTVASADTLAATAKTFSALPHRLTEIEDPSGLTFVDDTLATSPYASMHAIDAYEGRPLTVIVGGTDRGLDYSPLREHLKGRELTVIGIPDSGQRIVDALEGLPGVRTEVADDLIDAVRLARTVTPTDGAVLLSPAAPSYGRFRNFEHRSEVFVQAIRDTAKA
ncbi:UDP-N-acetylmuramoyl-L-alanine--D-glutamate ligase [Phytohabitans flavus]|uniref:UDP-N-acetylmuramoyl-L-alanine--L-glutamate ligase n=1 Tax=Phytohabitans flavus TaxID=1076124 RepID=A0A6F8XXA9_9ACTN|nr:UDP-N-acetylmuramoyl-L-alanine--D-glutamate ligase [Phytohabitans flavus]BCB78476.1 UDP-N-acetylmuramoylalanine--D-glutamate ligase [Phytohabitans flavus]